MRAAAIILLAYTVGCSTVSVADNNIAFPADYKDTFTRYMTSDRIGNDDQVMVFYANDVALQGVKDSGEFPDGSILVGEVYKAKKDADGNVLQSGLNRRVQDQLALVAVMEKQAGWGDAFEAGLKNGDWDFAAFKADGAVADKDLNACRACHAPLTDTQHVFSYEHVK